MTVAPFLRFGPLSSIDCPVMTHNWHLENGLASDRAEAELQRCLDGMRPGDLPWHVCLTIGHLLASARAGETQDGLRDRMGFDRSFDEFVARYQLGPVIQLLLSNADLHASPDLAEQQLAADRKAYDARGLLYRLGVAFGGRDTLIERLVASEDRISVPAYILREVDDRTRLAGALATLDALRAAASGLLDVETTLDRLGISSGREVVTDDPSVAAVFLAIRGPGSYAVAAGSTGLRPRLHPLFDRAA